MRALFFATRLAGTDGVSLEAAKMRQGLERLGHEVAYCAGELSGPGYRVEAMHFRDERAAAFSVRAFGGGTDDPTLIAEIERAAGELLLKLEDVVADVRPDLLVVQNAWAIPMQLPLAVALGELCRETRLPTLAHNHDYYWERERFANSRVSPLLEHFFPYHGENVRQLCINTRARAELRRRRGIDSGVLPNVLDFARASPPLDDFNADFRQAIGVASERPLLLQPTRVVPRKGIELAIDLAARLADLEPALVITHDAGDEGLTYLASLRRQAEALGVDLRHVADRVGDSRSESSGRQGPKRYSFWDCYLHADLVTYPSLYEGFGNALLEAIWFRRPLLVNRYSVYVDDIAPTGVRAVEIDGAITDATEADVRALLAGADVADEMTRASHDAALAHFSYEALETILRRCLASLGLDRG